MLLKEYYNSNIELESGNGRADIILESFKKEEMSYVIELKVAREEKDIEILGIEGLKQIKEKKYYNLLVSRKVENITIISIVFCEKDISFKYELI